MDYFPPTFKVVAGAGGFLQAARETRAARASALRRDARRDLRNSAEMLLRRIRRRMPERKLHPVFDSVRPVTETIGLAGCVEPVLPWPILSVARAKA